MPPLSEDTLPTTANPPQTRPAFPAGPGTVAVLVATALAVLVQLYAAIPLLRPVGAELGGNATFALSTVYGLCYAAGFLLWGPVADRYGRKRIIVLGLAILTVATLGCAFAGALPALAVLRGIQGLTAASFAPVALAYLSEAVVPQRRATAIGAMSTAFLVAGIVGQVVAQAAAQGFGWASMFLGSAAVFAACTLLTVLLLREPDRSAATRGLGGQFLVVAQLIARPAVLCLCLAHLTLLLAFAAMYTALGEHLADLGYDPDTVLGLRLVALPGMFAALAAGPLTRVLGGNAGLARAGYLLATVGLVVQALLSSSLVGLGVASLLFVTGIALTVPAMIGLFGEAAAPQRAGGMAVNGLVLFTGASLGPVLAAAGLAFPTLLFVLAALLGLAAISVTASAFLTNRRAENSASTPTASRMS